MEPLLLLIAGAAMGFVNNLAGAGGLIGLAALDLASGLGPATANASLRPAALAISAAGLLGFLSKRQQIPARAWLWGLASAPGAAAGAMLAVTLPAWIYQTVLVIVVGLVLAQQLRRAPAPSAEPPTGVGALGAFALFTLVGLHMGFLQVAVGLVTMLALSRVLTRDLVGVNAAKMAVLTVTSCVSVLCLASARAIEWGPAGWLAGGAAIGSFLAGRWTVRKGHGAVRAVVLIVCGFVLVRLAFQLVT